MAGEVVMVVLPFFMRDRDNRGELRAAAGLDSVLMGSFPGHGGSPFFLASSESPPAAAGAVTAHRVVPSPGSVADSSRRLEGGGVMDVTGLSKLPRGS